MKGPRAATAARSDLDQVPVTASGRGAVHGPDRRQAAVLLQKNIGAAVGAEIAGVPRRDVG